MRVLEWSTPTDEGWTVFSHLFTQQGAKKHKTSFFVLQISATGVRTLDLQSAPGELVMWAVWKYYDSIHLWVSWHERRQRSKSKEAQNAFSDFYPPLILSSRQNTRLNITEPWSTFAEVSTHKPSARTKHHHYPASALCCVLCVIGCLLCLALCSLNDFVSLLCFPLICFFYPSSSLTSSTITPSVPLWGVAGCTVAPQCSNPMLLGLL